MKPEKLLQAEVEPSKIFSGPSRLPQLQALHITHNCEVFCTNATLGATLDVVHLHGLNKAIEDPNSFPCLQVFCASVNCRMTQRRFGPLVLDDDQLVQLVVERLPAIFEVGGRKEAHRWTASVVPNILITLVP